MSSNTSGVSPFFGGLYSGSHRRPSMFTAKYRLREERKKVLKMSLAKIKRIEDPESFLRRSVLINNTMKQLQNDVQAEKMMRHGANYPHRFSQCLPYRKSFVYSRLNQMHLSLADELDSSDMDTSSPSSRTPTFKSLMLGTGGLKSSSDDSKDGCDLQAIFSSKPYAPPTPLLPPNTNNANSTDSSSSGGVALFTNSQDHNHDGGNADGSSCPGPASKKARTFIFSDPDSDEGSALVDITAADKPESINCWPTSSISNSNSAISTSTTFIQCSLSTTLATSSSSSIISGGGSSSSLTFSCTTTTTTTNSCNSNISSGCVLPSPLQSEASSSSAMIVNPSLNSPTNVNVSLNSLMSPSRLSVARVDLDIDDNAFGGDHDNDHPLMETDSSEIVRECSVVDVDFGGNPNPNTTTVPFPLEEETVSSSASDDFSLIDLSNVSTIPISALEVEVETSGATTALSSSLSSSTTSLNNGFIYTPPITTNTNTSSATAMLPSIMENASSQSSQQSQICIQDDINLSSDTKENKFTLPVASSNDSGSFSNPITTISSLDTKMHNCSNSDSHNCSQQNTNSTSESSENTKQKFSCGHSSVFGELQSVVFHSLIASLES